MGLDLTGVRTVLDDLIFDGSGVFIVEDNGVADDVLNEGTGELESLPGEQIYAGEGVILPVTSFGAGQVADIGIALTPTDSETTHKILLPLTAPAGIRVGQQVQATEVNPLMGDPQLVGRWFELTELPTTAALSVLRIAFLKPLRPRPVPEAEPDPDEEP